VFPGNGLGIDKMGLGVELLLGEQPVSASLLVVTTQLMSLLKNSSTVCFKVKRFKMYFQKHFILLESHS